MPINIAETLENRAGTYIILLTADHRQTIQVGKLGIFTVLPGHYFYVGSAHGPGGICSRVKHHLKISSKPHWHLDYLRPHCTVSEVWYSYCDDKLEHRWADTLAAMIPLSRPMKGFGSSDCHCLSHLLYTESPQPFFGCFTSVMLAQKPPSPSIHLITP